MAGNRERQMDEMEAISSICEEGEFYRTKNENYEIRLEVPVFLEKGSLDVKYSNVIQRHRTQQMYRHFSVRNLPPICLRLNFPEEYPESKAPEYELEIFWLPPWECSLVCQKLDELWACNGGSEILFLWRDFLRNEILGFLRHDESLDISFLFTVYAEPNDVVSFGLFRLSDERATNGAMFIHPMHYLQQFDESREIALFAKASHVCGICCEEFSGRKSIKFSKCGHIFCKNCTFEYLARKIEQQCPKILCPSFNCFTLVSHDRIKEICPGLWSKYENCVLKCALSKMKDIVFCPRRSCQLAVIIEPEETLARCGNCDYNFCSYCRKAYHGVAPCVISSKETANLVSSYLEADQAQKQILMKKYGRKQIQLVVEEHLSRGYLKEKTKSCPNCETPTEKIGGCNRMICANCNAKFCWLCGQNITTENPYDHFTGIDEKNGCYGRLFEGVLAPEQQQD